MILLLGLLGNDLSGAFPSDYDSMMLKNVTLHNLNKASNQPHPPWPHPHPSTKIYQMWDFPMSLNIRVSTLNKYEAEDV